MLTYTVNLIRHGQTRSNTQGVYIGCRTDIELTDQGKRQLKQLKSSFEYPKADMVFSSPLKRCVDSAKILYPNKQIITVDDMRECDFGDFEGKSPAELDGRPDFIAWTSGHMPAPPNGESSEQLVKRLCVGLNSIVKTMMNEQKQKASVIMHGGTIMMLLSACGLPQRHITEWRCGFGRGYTIRITPSLYHRTGAVEVVNEVPFKENDYE